MKCEIGDIIFLIGIVGPLGTAATNGLLVEWLAGETEILGANLPQCRFVDHIAHMLCPDTNPGRRSGKPVTNNLSYGTANWRI
jgi:hypothetical protein